MARYRLRDRRAARRVMDAAGGFRIGAGLFVRRSDLLDLEDRQRRTRAAAADHESGPRRTAAAPERPGGRQPLERGWWRREASEAA